MSKSDSGTQENENELAADSKNGRTVVGIGASAGGLAALKRLFELMPSDSGLAFVVVVHLSPEHKSHLPDLLQPSVRFPVQQVTETVPLEPNNVYVIPPNANLSAIDTHLRLSKLEEQRRERAPIDHFFRTLAASHDGHSIGVILTGTGSDGTLGLREIKAKGGLILVQDPNEAEYDGMPQSAIATGLVDRILSIEEMPEALVRLAEVAPRIELTGADKDRTEQHRAQLPKVLAILRTRTERDFSRYKSATLLRRVARRMQLNYLDDFAEYIEKLREQPEEARLLAEDLLITVTSFFRDPDAFKKLEQDVVPELFEGKGPGDTIRVWSVGCATGEEAYSVAILLLEEASRREAPPKIQIFASDMHKRSLEGAREGVYTGDIETDVSSERLKRFFRKENGGYRINREVREIVTFAPHNLLGDPPFSRLHLITCRNLLIYLDRSVQRDVIDLFHYALCPNGYLLLGSAETTDASDLFRTEDKKLCIYRKRNVPAPEPRLPVFPLMPKRVADKPGVREEPNTAPVAYHSVHQNLLERYAPPSILIAPDNRLAHLSEHAGRYLVLPGGDVTLSAIRLVREELRIELQGLLQSARETKQLVDSRPIPVRFNGHPVPVVMHVRPAQDVDQEGFVLVIFEEQQSAAEKPGSDTNHQQVALSEPGQVATRIAELEAELSAARQRLQATIEEYETTQEEMKASGEEMQSTNEELRSTLEELETSKEELQSINEELQTVNQENRHKVEELSQLSSDIQNLLTSTEIATLFLDRELRIMRFTPRLAGLFNVRVADRGRPILDLTHRLGYSQLRSDAEAVLERLVPIEREIQDEAKRWYLTRVLPYRSTEDRIEGVVITFVEITDRKLAEERLRESEQLRRVALAGGRMGTWRWDLAGRKVSGDAQFLALWGFPPSDDPLPLSAFTDRMSPKGSAEMETIVTKAIATEEEFDGPLEIVSGPTAGRWVQWRGRAATTDQSVLYGVTFDITEQKRTETQLRYDEERQAFLLALSDTMNALSNPVEIQQAAMQAVGSRLNLSRAFYFRVESDENGWLHVIDSEYRRIPDLPTMIGRHSLKNFGSALFEELARGSVLQVDDVAALKDLRPEELASYQAVQVAAFLNIPLRRSGEYSAGITAHDVAPRAWKTEEIDLLREVGQRTWEAVERARAEEALRESEERLRRFGEASQDVLWIRNAETFQWEYLTPAFETIYGLDRQAALGGDNMAGWLELVVPDDRDRAAESLRRVQSGEWVTFEYRIRRPADGRIRWLRNTDFPIRNAAGQVSHIGGVGHDITAIKEAEEALAAAELRQRALLEGIPQFVWRAVNIGEWTWASPQWSEYTGQAEATSHGWGWLDPVHPDDREMAKESWSNAMEWGGFEVEYRLLDAGTQTYRWFQTRATPVRDSDGSIIEWLGTSTDVEGMKQTETALREAEEKFRLFVENVQEYALVQTDSAGAITNWNPGAQRLFGYSSEQMVGRDFSSVLITEDQERDVFRVELAAGARGQRSEDARWLVRKDGSRFWARWISEPILDGTGRFIGLAKIMRDETERERAETFTKHSLAEKEELLKEVHHRVKNNLQVIISLLNMQMFQIQEDRVLALFQETRNRVLAISSIHELLYRAESFANVKLTDYARQLVPGLVRFYGLEEKVRIEIVGDGATLELERAVPYGMLLNELVSNACKHAFLSSQTGTLTISVQPDGGDIVLVVSDTGPGLPVGFDYRKASSLGLKLVHGLVRKVRGALEISSPPGTTVNVRFPVAGPEPDE